MPVPESERSRLIKVIHLAKRELGLSDEEYREVLFATTKKISCANMNLCELDRVKKRFYDLGFGRSAPTLPDGKTLSPVYGRGTQEAKLVACWITAHQHKLIDDPSHEALIGYVWAGKERPATLRGGDLLEAASWKLKSNRIQGLVEMLARAGVEYAG